ncbi:phosphate ABC transporter permease PstA [Terricaulis silvestris]|uniref:Phosphate transport system permease protein PstA n=1 Tax=Terricaulis silvestris TaxID=2686094 RepID=A0A6I6MQL6_9CAUL|nr:phosphate ABC transporter permease PstA [Terricaulis silvestris]QGZ96451.1 Phosphate transport system permease protein PstA [Terricaulis silvestris]
MAAVDVQRVRDITEHPPGLGTRKFKDAAFVIWGIIATIIGLGTLVALVSELIHDGGHRLSAAFFWSFPSSEAADAGILSAWVGSLLVIATTALFAIPIGIMAGIYLEEYAHKNPVTSAIEIAVNNLAGVPSILFGLMAVGIFVQFLGNPNRWFAFLPEGFREAAADMFGQSILTAGITLSLLILPVVIVATREAVRSVPQEMRQGALAVGATKWQTTQHHVLPYALPGVVTGVIIGISRALGETAPLIMIGGLTFVAFLPITRPGDAAFEVIGAVDEYGAPVTPDATESVRIAHDGVVVLPDFTEMPVVGGQTYDLPHGSTVQSVATWGDAVASWSPTHWLGSEFTVMPIQMFNWTSRPQAEFLEIAAAAGLVLLGITLLMNGTAIFLRYRLRRSIKW